ncbi:helix-turn-helix domain-containing protein [Shimia sp. R11_0]|uniref:helix-turn-helix domain-containing protein n=1 Tax=Shimia sp. R11_0 TaxID=2821096 RepID=UPI001ADBA5E7|nr:helix-turn-helix domain-containing protein [Shimia sp. R11_0]MBO9478566.1 helix-turn-helix domain-containing protein [Shimia sp. R11_0]
MGDFIRRRKLSRLLDQAAAQTEDWPMPEGGWIATMRHALGMSADQVAQRKGVSRNAVYQAERNEVDGAVSLKQMQRLAEAMGGRFVYAIVPKEPVERLKYHQACATAQMLALQEPDFATWPADEQQDWVDDKTAELLHDMPSDFWKHRPQDPNQAPASAKPTKE